MTRETKIGLLVGLGFIITFAVLLSHTTPPPPAGDGLTVEGLRQDNGKLALSGSSRSMAPDPLVVSPGTSAPASSKAGPSATPSSPGTSVLASADHARAAAREGVNRDESKASSPKTTLAGAEGSGLPRPGALEPQLTRRDVLANVKSTKEASVPPADRKPLVVAEAPRPRVAPPLSEPLPEPVRGQRPSLPAVSPSPSPAPATGLAQAQQPLPVMSPPAKVVEPKEHVVRPGDTVGEIASAYYGTSKPIIVDFLTKANGKRIENKDKVIAGQKLVIPPLPPELFEKVSGFNVAKMQDGVRSMTLQELAEPSPAKPQQGREIERRAPQPSNRAPDRDKTSNAGATDLATGPTRSNKKTEARTSSKPEFRWYEVKPGDTPTSIARRQLGSVEMVKEIKRLNPTLDPRKMRPGERLRLPNKPVSEPFKTKPASA